MIDRHLYNIAFSDQWGRQMRFITGPRQVGKTTLARQKLTEAMSQPLYYLWDLREVRRRYKDNELFFTADMMPSGNKKLWVCFDEVHKMPKWKNILKAAFDETSDWYHFVVTGSAKLDIVKRAGDSLAGRYFAFHLMPLMLSEVHANNGETCVPQSALEFVEKKLNSAPAPQDTLMHLLKYSGFPEPFLRNSQAFYNKWSRDYIDSVIREDIVSLTRIIDREYIFDLYNLIPEMAGSPLSHSSLASHLQISPATVKNYLRRLDDFYLTFVLKPYSKNIKRSLLKAGKYYLYNWSNIKDDGARFENYVACELKTKLALWGDATGDEFQLFYVRNKQKQETDFLVIRNGLPWLLMETKLSDGSIDPHHFQTIHALGGVPFVQVCLEPGIASIQKRQAYRISASRFFG